MTSLEGRVSQLFLDFSQLHAWRVDRFWTLKGSSALVQLMLELFIHCRISCSFIRSIWSVSSKTDFFLTDKRSNSWGSSACLLQSWKMPSVLEIFREFSCQTLSSSCLNMCEQSFAASQMQAALCWRSGRLIHGPSSLPSPHLPLCNSPLPSPVPDFKAQRHQHFSGKWLWKKEGLWRTYEGLISFSETPTVQLKFSKGVQLSELIRN